MSHEYESVRRVIYGDGDYEGATFVPVCEMCGRFVKPGTVTFRNDTIGHEPNATCSNPLETTPRDHDEKPMTEDEALEVLKDFAIGAQRDPIIHMRVDQALATLDRLRAHFSKFKAGDVLWFIHHDDRAYEDEVVAVGFWNGITLYSFEQFDEDSSKESDCFPTREEAEAEAARRNEAQ